MTWAPQNIDAENRVAMLFHLQDQHRERWHEILRTQGLGELEQLHEKFHKEDSEQEGSGKQ